MYMYTCILPGSCEYPLSNSKQGGGFQVNIYIYYIYIIYIYLEPVCERRVAFL